MRFGVGMELGWGGFDRAKLDMLILIRIPFSFHDHSWYVCIIKLYYVCCSYIAEFIASYRARGLTGSPCRWQSPDSSFPLSPSLGWLSVGQHFVERCSCRLP